KADKAEAPKSSIVMFDLATNKVTGKFEGARSVQVVGTGAGYALYHKEPKAETKESADKAEPEKQKEVAPMPKKVGVKEGSESAALNVAALFDQQPGGAQKGGGKGAGSTKGGGGFGKGGGPGGAGAGTGGPATPRTQYGSDLVVRNLANGSEVTFP